MRIISWNVNGLRASYKKGAFQWLIDQSPDIFCLQETKSEAHQLPEEVRSPIGYHAYFNSSKTRKGYSGVAIYSKIEPNKVEYGLGIEEMDQEGRLVIAYFDEFVLINGYFPNGGSGPDRLEYKLEFYDHFLNFIKKLQKKGIKVIFCGDVNTAHTAIDLARPKENEKNTGFLPIERAWIDRVVKADFIDIWRNKNIDKKDVYTYWDMKTASRGRNVGWRIDYFFIDSKLIPNVKNVLVHGEVMGSDHCPLELDIEG
ncbi:MAG: exodeoxyribonuclease III [Minisyncoccota bacterium]